MGHSTVGRRAVGQVLVTEKTCPCDNLSPLSSFEDEVFFSFDVRRKRKKGVDVDGDCFPIVHRAAWQNEREGWRKSVPGSEWFTPESEFRSRSRNTTWHWQNTSRTSTGFGAGYGYYNFGQSSNDYASTPAFPDVDMYTILGVERGASMSEVKKAYRTLAMQLHPDLNPHIGEEGINRMKKVAMAYSVLRDNNRRQIYDREGFPVRVFSPLPPVLPLLSVSHSKTEKHINLHDLTCCFAPLSPSLFCTLLSHELSFRDYEAKITDTTSPSSFPSS